MKRFKSIKLGEMYMKTIEELKSKLETARPEEWQLIPDIDLYMDQVIAYMKRQHIGLEDDDETLTSAMINNYTKSGLLPRAKGKKYNREHIEYLTSICLLKQILSVNETGILLNEQIKHKSIDEFYNAYKEVIDREYTNTAECLTKTDKRSEISQMAVELAVSSYVQRYACKKLVEMLAESDEPSEEKESEEK